MSKASTNQQAATKADLKAFAEQIVSQLRGEMKAQGEQLRSEMKEQGKQLRGEMQTMEKSLHGEMQAQGEELRGEMRGVEKSLRSEMQGIEKGLRSEMDAQEEKIVVRIRDELDSKLAATTYELKRHTEDVVAAHSSEVLDAIASVVEPLQTEVQRHAILLNDLAAKVA